MTADCARHQVGLAPAELEDCWAYIAAMLYLGNIEFGTGDDKAVITALGPNDPVRRAEVLLGVEDMSVLLCQRQITVNGEITYAQQTPASARTARDALVKIMYSRLFDYLVLRVNQTVDDAKRAKMYDDCWPVMALS